MTKVQILTTCNGCNGKAYVPIGEAEDANGLKYLRHAPCSMCEGYGQCPKWVSLEEFAALLKEAECPHEHTSFRGGFHFSAGEVWDDLTEICTDCGANLDKLAKETTP